MFHSCSPVFTRVPLVFHCKMTYYSGTKLTVLLNYIFLPDVRVLKNVKIARQNCNITTLGGGGSHPQTNPSPQELRDKNRRLWARDCIPPSQNKDIQKCIFLLKVRKGFFQSAMLLASALKRGSHPPENILKI